MLTNLKSFFSNHDVAVFLNQSFFILAILVTVIAAFVTVFDKYCGNYSKYITCIFQFWFSLFIVIIAGIRGDVISMAIWLWVLFMWRDSRNNFREILKYEIYSDKIAKANTINIEIGGKMKEINTVLLKNNSDNNNY